jgi:hypothetical protein
VAERLAPDHAVVQALGERVNRSLEEALAGAQPPGS